MRSIKVYIHCSSPTLRGIVVLVFTKSDGLKKTLLQFFWQPLPIGFGLSETYTVFLFSNGWDKSRQTTILKKWTTTLSLQNMFRSIFDHLQLQVVHDEFEFHLKLQCDWAYVITLPLEFKLPGNVTTRLKWIKRVQTVEQIFNTFP